MSRGKNEPTTAPRELSGLDGRSRNWGCRLRILAALVLLVATQFLWGCRTAGSENTNGSMPGRPEESSGASAPLRTATLRLEEAARVGDLTVRWISVNDSRCPLGAQCVWEGEVTAEVEITSGDEESETVTLTLRAGTQTEVPVIAGHELRLLRVDPVPVHGKDRVLEDLTAEIQVRETAASRE